jgi:hypothetical protein
MFGGTGADREAALSYAAMCLAALPDGAEAAEVACTAHVVIAWMALARQLTVEQRSAMMMNPAVGEVRLDSEAASSLVRRLGNFAIARSDAETAITHLRLVPAVTGIVAPRGLVTMLWATALFVTVRADGAASAELAGDTRRVADELSDVAVGGEMETLERGELLALRSLLLATEARAFAEEGGDPSTMDSLTEAAAGLPVGHYLRSPILDTLGHMLGHQVSEAASADDVGVRLEAIAGAMEQMPQGDPGLGRSLVSVGMQILAVGVMSRTVSQREPLISLFERLVPKLATDDPMLPLAQHMRCLARCMQGVLQHRAEMVDAAIEEMVRYVGIVPLAYPFRPYMLSGVATAYVERHAMGGEIRHLEQATDLIARALAEVDPEGPFAEGTQLHGVLLYLRGHIQVAWCYYEPTPELVTAAIADLERAKTLVGQDTGISSGIGSTLETARVMRERIATPSARSMSLGAEERAAFDRMLEVAERTSPDRPQYFNILAQASAGLVLRGLADHDIKLIDRAISLLGEACSSYALAVRERPRLLELHGQGLLTRYSLTRVPSDLSNAIDRLEEARRAVEQEIGSPHAASVLQTLAEAYRTRGNAARGDVDRAVTLGLAGLREHAGDVFLQDSDENALLMARRGTSDAGVMARWFLDHDRDAAAISALELGRGMVLQAATWGAGVEAALRAAGHPCLADEWAEHASRGGSPSSGQQRPGEGGTDLRYRVMLAIEQSPAEARLLAPPAIIEVTAALTATGTDALVYLLPRDDDGAGMAVVVYPDGTVSRLPLPGLYVGDRGPVGAFLRERRAADAAALIGPVKDDAARNAWLETLGTLSGWAWQAAVGPVLGAIPARVDGTERRIVLMPVGELGLVPWHAARWPGGGDRYACQSAVFCYASSARQFVDTARHRPRQWSQSPVLISDADGSLYVTAAGIAHLYDAHYRAAAVFGDARNRLAATVPGAPTATRADVLAALPRAGVPGASLLHFGCHGRVQVPALGSSLRLGGDESNVEARVEVRDILRQSRSRRAEQQTAQESGGLVVLASCLTDVTEHDFDEALSLATAFLSAGAVGVVAARWSVGSTKTALFMNVFHQFLNGGYPHPARALFQAQKWMLDPDRDVPDNWPKVLRDEAAMAGRPGYPDLASPEAWAGFAYQGM